jgi:adenylate cyclase
MIDAGEAEPLPARVDHRGPPAIAVLPFKPLAEDMEFVADGIADDIATGLANIRWLPVISRSSTFQFRDERLNSLTAGRALGAGYLVSGTVGRDAELIRLSLVLEDVMAGRVLWTRQFDGEFSKIADLQDRVGSQIVAILEGQVDRAEQTRAFQMPWEDLETWQLVRRGRWHMNRRTSPDTRLALECYEKAREADPNSSAVLGELAWWYFWRAWVSGGDRDDLETTASYSLQALYMDSQDARPHAYLGACEIMRRHPGNAVPHFQEALRINPSYAFAHSGMGSSKLLMGNPSGSIEHFQQAARLSPFDIYQFHNLGELASAQFHCGQLEEAVETASQSLALSPGYFLSRIVKIGALGRLGRLDEADAELQIFRHRSPDFDMKRVEWIPYVDASFNRSLLDTYHEIAKVAN